jgi:type VI secretion system secreted protein Hcp
MAVDMFIKLGDIKGEAVGSGHKDEIDVLAWSWGMSNSGNAHVGGGAGAGKVNVQDLSFTKYVDKSSKNLIASTCGGDHFKTATLTVQKAGGTKGGALEYIKIQLDTVFVTSVSAGGSGGEDRLTENVTLNFAKFKYIYTPQESTGKPGTPLDTAWDIAKNEEWK